MTALLSSNDDRTLFVSGCVRARGSSLTSSMRSFYSARLYVILERVANRTTNSYGKTHAERRLIQQHVATVEPLLRAHRTHELDATRPLDVVVADMIAIASRPMTTS